MSLKFYLIPMKKHCILLGFVLLVYGTSLAQDMSQNVLRCRGSRVTNLANGDDFGFAVDVRLVKQQRIEWIQQNGQRIHTYTITSVNGTWTDLSQPGSVTYAIVYQDKPGQVHIERDAAGVYIVCDLRGGSEGSYYKLFIDNVSLDQ